MKRILFAMSISLAVVLAGRELFVSMEGNDTADGLCEKNAFRTIQRGVNSLTPGDTLTILPGCYHEAVRRSFDGDASAKTVIQAKYTGSVLLHGDLPLRDFRVFDLERGIYSTDCPKAPEAVIEHDSLGLYANAGPDLLTAPMPPAASWHYDAAQKRLYLRTSDGAAPASHRLAYVALDGDGLILTPALKGNVLNVEIDGLIARGFIKRDLPAYSSVWGISIVKPKCCVIRRCCAVLNSGGINFSEAQSSRIEDCRALGNGTASMVSGGNIIVTSGSDSLIDRCFSFASRMYGIRFYGNNINDTISRSISLEDRRGSIWIKPSDKDSLLREIYTPSDVACNRTEHSVFRGNEYDADGKNCKESLYLKKDTIHAHADDFADPEKFDLRLSENANLRQGFTGSDFYYLSPDGSDTNSGRSLKSPKRCLDGIADGATIYLLPGKYNGEMRITQNDLIFCRYGQGAPAVICGMLHVTGKNVRLRDLSFVSDSTSIICNGEGLQIENCGFAKNAIAVRSSAAVAFLHCAFDGSITKITDHPGCVFLMNIIGCAHPEGAILFGNAYAVKPSPQDKNAMRIAPDFAAAENGDFTLKNESDFRGTAADGTMAGPCSFLYEPQSQRYSSIKVLTNGPNTASLQYERVFSNHGNSWAMLREVDKAWSIVPDPSVNSALSYIALTELKPDTAYECCVASRKECHYAIGNHWLPARIDYKKTGQVLSGTLRFVTPAVARAPQSWHVAPSGQDTNPGTASLPFRTITKAALMTAPGDMVVIHEGTYRESVLIPFSGCPGKTITYCAAPGETVWLDGDCRQFCRTFAAFGKQHLLFDGFHVKKYGTALANSSGVFLLFGCKDVRITRCLHDGRGNGYAPALLHVRNSTDIEMRNCVNINSMGGVCILNCDRVTLEHNVLKMSLIWPLQVVCGKKNAVRFAYNVVTDSIRGKTTQPLISLNRPDAIDEHCNIYFMRLPKALRKLVGSQGKSYTLDEYYKATDKNGGSEFADPGFPAMPRMLCWKSLKERTDDQKKDMAFQREVNNYENGRDAKEPTRFRVWSFRDFLATPALMAPDGKAIGLEPAEFKDFPVYNGERWHTL